VRCARAGPGAAATKRPVWVKSGFEGRLVTTTRTNTKPLLGARTLIQPVARWRFRRNCKMAIRACQAVAAAGLATGHFFYDEKALKTLCLNEINTLPGLHQPEHGARSVGRPAVYHCGSVHQLVEAAGD